MVKRTTNSKQSQKDTGPKFPNITFLKNVETEAVKFIRIQPFNKPKIPKILTDFRPTLKFQIEVSIRGGQISPNLVKFGQIGSKLVKIA